RLSQSPQSARNPHGMVFHFVSATSYCACAATPLQQTNSRAAQFAFSELFIPHAPSSSSTIAAASGVRNGCDVRLEAHSQKNPCRIGHTPQCTVATRNGRARTKKLI